MLRHASITLRSALPVLLGCLLSSYAVAAPPKFASVYTNLAKDCRADETAADDGEGELGEDVPLLCKGYGAYRGYLFFSALHNIFVVQSARAPHAEQSGQILLEHFDKGMVEWRLADGEPFAVIVRALEADRDGARRPAGLIVMGLGQYARIQARIPTARNPAANQQARDAADAGYSGQ